jgi:hypothetical protein
VRLKANVIVSAAPPPTLSAKQATVTIPIVMAYDEDHIPPIYVNLALSGEDQYTFFIRSDLKKVRQPRRKTTTVPERVEPLDVRNESSEKRLRGLKRPS